MSDVTGAEAVTGAPARELIESGFALENADAPLLHHGLNLADIAHVLDLRGRRVVPEDAARQLLSLLLEVYATPAEDFPYDPSHGEAYNSREHYFASRLGDVAGWLHAGRPRREATRHRPAPAPAPPARRARRGRRRLRRQRGRPGHHARRDVDAGPDLPPAGPAVDLRPLRAVLRLPHASRRPAPARGAGVGRHQPRWRRLRQRQPPARGPVGDRRACSASTG